MFYWADRLLNATSILSSRKVDSFEQLTWIQVKTAGRSLISRKYREGQSAEPSGCPGLVLGHVAGRSCASLLVEQA